MNVYSWLLAGAFALSALITVGMVGREREPTTPIVAMFTVLIDAVFIWLTFKAVGAA